MRTFLRIVSTILSISSASHAAPTFTAQARAGLQGIHIGEETTPEEKKTLRNTLGRCDGVFDEGHLHLRRCKPEYSMVIKLSQSEIA